MYKTDFASVALFEHRFWLQILGDHSRFIILSLSPTEADEIKQAEQFKIVFDQLLEQARQDLAEPGIALLTTQAVHYAAEIRTFKLHLLQQLLLGKININLPPTFINHMVNEVEEYQRVLGFLVAGEIPADCHPLHYHLVCCRTLPVMQAPSLINSIPLKSVGKRRAKNSASNLMTFT